MKSALKTLEDIDNSPFSQTGNWQGADGHDTPGSDKIEKWLNKNVPAEDKKSGGESPEDNDPKQSVDEDGTHGGGSGKSWTNLSDEELNELKTSGKKRISEVRKKLRKHGLIRDPTLKEQEINLDSERFDIIERPLTDQPFKVDYALAHALENQWRRIRGMTKQMLDEDGDELDVDVYIQNIPAVVKDNDMWYEESPDTGFHVLISADTSGSMSGYPLKCLRDTAATFKASLNKLPNVKVSMLSWGGGRKTGITIHKTMDDINHFECASGYNGTPEKEALWYSKTWLAQKREAGKLLLFCSDMGFSKEAAQDEIKKSRELGINVFGVMFTNDNVNIRKDCDELFGVDQYAILDDTDKANTHLVNSISKYVTRHMLVKH